MVTLRIKDYEFSLKNVKYMASLSDETNCYTATLYCNGKRIATCDNRGNGEQTNVRYYKSDANYNLAVEAFAAAKEVRDTEYEKELEEIMKQWGGGLNVETFCTPDHICDKLFALKYA